jgi:hypothetical protein
VLWCGRRSKESPNHCDFDCYQLTKEHSQQCRDTWIVRVADSGYGCGPRICRSDMHNPPCDGWASCRATHCCWQTDCSSCLGGGQVSPIFELPPYSLGHLYIADCLDPLYWLSQKLHWPGLSDASRGLGKEQSCAIWDLDCDPPIPKPVLQFTEVGLQITDEKRLMAGRGYDSRIIRVLR